MKNLIIATKYPWIYEYFHSVGLGLYEIAFARGIDLSLLRLGA